MKLKINDNAFKQYTKEACYWAGFIAADGSVDKKNRCRIYLSDVDIDHLYKFKIFLKSEHKVGRSYKYNRCSFEFTNKSIVQDLDKYYKIKPLKSKFAEFPSDIPDKYMSHFIRGLWDGDGTICESITNENSITKSYITSVVGADPLITEMVVYLEDNIFHKALPYVRYHPNNINVVFKMNTLDSIAFTNWLYKDSDPTIRLDRKFKTYKKVVIDNNRAKV